MLKPEEFREPEMEGIGKKLEEVEEGVEAIKGIESEGKFEESIEGDESKKDGKEDDKVWMNSLGDDLKPVEVTRSEYLAKNPIKRV